MVTQKEIDALLNANDIDKLVKFLKKANTAYRNTSKPIVSDETYDLLEDKLRDLDPKNAFLSKVGAVPVLNKVTLPFWMGSLDKIKDDPKAIEKWKNTYTNDVVISDKLDGNSAMIYYKNGVIELYSRGNGKIGQNISHLIPFIKAPIIHDKIVAIRGEIIISKKNWDIIHAAFPEFSNPRNLVAGILHSKTPDPNIAKYIEFIAYELIQGAPNMIPSNTLKFIHDLGFKTVYNSVLTPSEITVQNLSDILIRRRNVSEYEIDGIVVYDNKTHTLASGKNPKYAFAFKSMLNQNEAEVTVNKVEWNISKDGYYKPTVLFDTINLGGVNIQKATGFNAAFIERYNIGSGAKIIIIRSGDVIPHILRVIKDTKADFPEGNWEWNDSHIDIIIKKDEEMNAQQKLKILEHFAKTLEIKFVAKGVLTKLIEAGFDTIPKIFKITVEDLLKLDGFKKTSAEKIVKSIQDTYKTATCIQMMTASNIFGHGFGSRRLTAIIDKMPQILKRKIPTLEEVKSVEGIGEISGKAFLQELPIFFEFMDSIPMDCKLESSSSDSSSAANISFKDMKILFTGFRNKEWETLIEKHDGKVITSISKNTTLVVAADPDESSSKLEKARSLEIKIMSKEEFEKEYILV